MNQANKYAIAVTKENVDSRAPIVFRGDIERCADLAKQYGYDAIEIQMRDPEKMNVESVKKICDERGLGISGIATGMEYTMNGYSMIDDDPIKRKAAVERFREYIAVGKIWNCSVVFGLLRGVLPDGADKDYYYRRLCDDLGDVLKTAEKENVTIVTEAMNIYCTNWINTVAENVQFIKDIGSPALKLHIDTHHMNIDEDNMRCPVYCGAPYLGYVHLADGNRLYPGGGCIDYLTFMKDVMETGYDGYYSVECVPTPSQEACAKHAITYIKHLEAAIRSLPQK